VDYSLFIALPFMCAALLALGGGRLRAAWQGALMAAVLAGLCALALVDLPAVTAGALTQTRAWIPSLGLDITLYIDGLSWLFVLLVTGIGAAVMLYAGYYFDDPRESARFLTLMMAFSGAMLALVLAGNVLLLFIAWELTSILSFLLIGFKGKEAAARYGASQALVITGGGGLALLAGLLLMSAAGGSTDFATLLTSGDVLRQHPLYAPMTLLILIGCFSKSAQFPLHFWLPGAMSAPTPASSFLHSATMVKAGVYLLLRLYPALGDTDLWTMLLPLFGLVTLAVGAFIALGQRDLKGALAYSTIAQLGGFVALIGLPHAHGIKAALVGILAHALYKCALFLVAGAVDHAVGTRLFAKLGGLRTHMGGYAAVTAVAALSMAGVPPLLGFVGKELLLESALEESTLTLMVVLTTSMLTVAMGLALFWDVFMGRSLVEADKGLKPLVGGHDDSHDSHHFHPLPPLMVVGPAVLAALSLLLGVGVGALVPPLIEPALGADTSLYLIPPSGINNVFILSMIALALGVIVFVLRDVWRRYLADIGISAAWVYGRVISGIEALGDLALLAQNGKIRSYLIVIFTTISLLLLLIIPGELANVRPLTLTIANASDALKGILILLAIATTFASVIFRRHLLAALALGVAGYAIGGVFLLEPAPDVALVQFLVETLATVLIIIILARTSDTERRKVIERVWTQSRFGLTRDIVLSATIGVGVAVFALAAVSSRPTPNPISLWHLQNALPEVGVNDVVAGIITDFRGLDTLVEITVFSMAAFGVLSVLTRQSPGRVRQFFNRRIGGGTDPTEAERTAASILQDRFDEPITRTAAALVLPFAMLIAAAHIAYAGAAPGDGFTAGVILGLAVALWFIVFGYNETKARLRWLRPPLLIGVGLLLAFGNALAPLLWGDPFLAHNALQNFGPADIKLASTTLYEIGICLAVFGSVSAIMESITHPEEVEHL
jgi:NADH:ubiquinone oxidoreductase subunit 5 (subunit L)/multisubunit Na+/H+ antiporter MnhA subunit/multisubunit Na+/H+ antiporter MnhB subunit